MSDDISQDRQAQREVATAAPLPAGEIGVEVDGDHRVRLKVGDGATSWDDLPEATLWRYVHNDPVTHDADQVAYHGAAVGIDVSEALDSLQGTKADASTVATLDDVVAAEVATYAAADVHHRERGRYRFRWREGHPAMAFEEATDFPSTTSATPLVPPGWTIALGGDGSVADSSAFHDGSSRGTRQLLGGLTAGSYSRLQIDTDLTIGADMAGRVGWRVRYGSESTVDDQHLSLVGVWTGAVVTGNFCGYGLGTQHGQATFQAIAGDGSGALTVRDTGIEVPTGNSPPQRWWSIGIAYTLASAVFTMDGVEVARISTNLPEMGHPDLRATATCIKTIGTAVEPSIDIDWCGLSHIVTRPVA